MSESIQHDYWDAHWTSEGFPPLPSLTPAAKALLGSKDVNDRAMQMVAAFAGANPAAQLAMSLHLHNRPQVPANAEPFLSSEEFQSDPAVNEAILRMGSTARRFEAWMRLHDLHSGLATCGQIGRGKTSMVESTAAQAVLLGATVIVIDFKGTWRRLLQIPSLGSRAIVLSCHDLRISIGQPPPGCDVMDWWSVVAHCWGAAYGRMRAHQLLLVCMEACSCPPKLSELLQHAHELARGPRNYETELARGLAESLDNMYRESGQMFEVNGSDMIEQLVSTPGKLIIIEESRAGLEHTQFLIALIMNWAYRLRRSNRELLHTFHPLLFLLEDASNLLDPRLDANTVSGTSPIASVQDVCREFKIGLLPVFHSLRSLSPKIARNINNWVAVGLQGDDLDVAQRIMGLHSEQAQSLLRLGDGEAVGLFPSVNPRPIFFTYPMLEVPNG